MRVLRVAAVGVATATTACIALGVLAVVGVLTPPPDDIPDAIIPFVAIAVLAPTAIGLLIALRRPRNVIAWIMLVGALLVALEPVDWLVGHGWALQTGRATWPVLYAWPIAITYVFPNGQLLSRRWRWVVGAGTACFLGFMALAMLDTEPFDSPYQAVPNPVAGNPVAEWVSSSPFGLIWIPLWLGILASLFAGALAVRLRLRRSTGVERLQTMWLAWAAALIPLGLVLCAASWTFFGFVDVVVFPFLLVMQAAIAVSVGIAVTRYRLYTIERLVNRTVVYALVTFVLLGTYAAVSVGLGVAVGGDSTWVTAAATLVAALAFRPLRARVQDLVDRRFSRARYDGVRRVRSFEEEVRDGRRAPEDIGGVLAAALGDATAELLFWLPASETYAD
jgi:hypothetical protein